MNDPSDKPSKWAAPGGDMDDYFDEAQALREELAEVKKKLIWLEDLEGQEDNLAARAKEVEGILAGRDEKLIGAEKEIKHQRGLRAIAENTAERLERELKTERERAGKEKATLEKSEARLFAENTRLRGDKSVADLKFWGAVGIGVAGTIWGSLGNPLPFIGNSSASDEKITQCALADTAQKANDPNSGELASSVPWVRSNDPRFFVTKAAANRFDGRVNLRDVEFSDWGNKITGTVSNLSAEPISTISVYAYYLASDGEGCSSIWQGWVSTSSALRNSPAYQSQTVEFEIPVRLPKNTASVDGAEWRFTSWNIN